MKSNFISLTKCVACGGHGLFTVLDLNNQPLANDYSDQAYFRDSYELKLNACDFCFHSQLSISVDPEIMFQNYPYVSSTSETMRTYFREISKLIKLNNVDAQSILDIGSNDGTFLSNFDSDKWAALGVDPAVNLVASAIDKNVLTLPTVFNLKTSKLLAKDFDIVTAFNVFAHTSNPKQMLEAIHKVTHEQSKIYIQTSQANMILDGQFDTIYHEHISFFNVNSMKILLNSSGFHLDNVEIVDVHGGSYLWTISKSATSKIISAREEFEVTNKLNTKSSFVEYIKQVESTSTKLVEIVKNLKSDGFKICTYGSAAKGNTVLNYLNILPEYIFDDTPEKIGKYSPVGNVKVLRSDFLSRVDGKILIIIPAWNFASEIQKNIGKINFIADQVKILIYYPKIKVLDLEIL